ERPGAEGRRQRRRKQRVARRNLIREPKAVAVYFSRGILHECDFPRWSASLRDICISLDDFAFRGRSLGNVERRGAFCPRLADVAWETGPAPEPTAGRRPLRIFAQRSEERRVGKECRSRRSQTAC